MVGCFYCYGLELNSLEGCPEKVDGNFICHENNLENLEGCPQVITGAFLANWVNGKERKFSIGDIPSNVKYGNFGPEKLGTIVWGRKCAEEGQVSYLI